MTVRPEGAMSDDERLARLTELARRVPEWADERNLRVEQDQYGLSVVSGHRVGEWNDLLTALHPRALDALEAALLVLADESVVIWPRHMRTSPAWVEQLAAELEMTGHGARDAHNEEVAQAYFDCAAELRARARQP